jgi:hypothetical protein
MVLELIPYNPDALAEQSVLPQNRLLRLALFAVTVRAIVATEKPLFKVDLSLEKGKKFVLKELSQDFRHPRNSPIKN